MGDKWISTSRDLDNPEPGFWAMRMATRAPEIGAKIARVHTVSEPDNPDNLMDRSSFLAAWLDGDIVSVHAVWTRRGRPITEAEYVWLVEDRKWAKQYAPGTPEAEPRKKLDIDRIPLPF